MVVEIMHFWAFHRIAVILGISSPGATQVVSISNEVAPECV